MAEKIRIGVIFGGRSGEHAVSLLSARSVLSVLDGTKYVVTEIGITQSGQWLGGENALSAFENNTLSDIKPVLIRPDAGDPVVYTLNHDANGISMTELARVDIFFPVLHGTFGEDGTLQGLFELADIAYVGAGVLGSAVGMDKSLFKDVMRSNGIPVVESLTVTRKQIKTDLPGIIAKAESMAPYPFFIKPANLGSSVGITKCTNRSDLMEGCLEAASFDRRVLIERGVNGREIEVSVLGNEDPRASIPGEVIPTRDFYDYEAKYISDDSRLLIPAPLTAEQVANVQRLAIKAYKAVDCAGMARADFFIDRKTGSIYINEINTIPGFTRISMYPKLWEASGLPYPQLVDTLIQLALERKAERDATEREYRRQS